MVISDKLALEIYTIVLFHILAILLVSGFTFYLSLKAKKTQLFYSYISVVGMLLIWMISKIFKTVSPNESIRWFFIVTQYIGVDFLGYSLILFALLYTRGKLPKRPFLLILSLPPCLGFLTVLTNPLHMKFYSYYDFYKDSFGSWFFPFHIVQYLYLFIGIFILASGFTNQPAFQGHKKMGHLFALLVLFPISGNIYYLLVKLTDLPWFFDFPFFDFTPITSAIALVLFMIPAMKYRFLDISNIAYRYIFNQLPSGIVFLSPDGFPYAYNTTFISLFKDYYTMRHLDTFMEQIPLQNDDHRAEMRAFLAEDCTTTRTFLAHFDKDVTYKIYKHRSPKKHTLLFFTDLSFQIQLSRQLEEKNKLLFETHLKLEALAQSTKELAATRTQTKIAQDIHDILGHSLTVVIGTADLAAASTSSLEVDEKLYQIKELLMSSLTDLKNAIEGKSLDLGYTTLIRAISSLKNDNILLDFVVQGKPYELNSSKTEAIYRICQEAMTNAIKHGQAKTIHLILRFKRSDVELFAIDDGVGCKSISKSFGLSGMEQRVLSNEGQITFGSYQSTSEGTGFHIHVVLPV